MAINNPKTIPPTLVATDDPLSLCTGALALIKDVPVLPLGLSYNGTFFQYERKVAGFDRSVSGKYSLFFGLCGPSWATTANVKGTYGNGSGGGTEINLQLSDTLTEAGLVFGAAAGLDFSVSMTTWVHDFNFDVNVTADAVQLLFTLAQVLLGDKALVSRVSEKLPSVESSWGAFDSTSDNWAANDGQLSVNPAFSIPFNLWSLMLIADETSAIFGGLVVASNAVLDATLSSITIGPTFGLGVDLSVKMEQVLLNNVPYPITGFDGASSLTAQGPGAPPASISSIGFGFSQTPYFDFQLGLTAQLQLLQLLNFSASYTIDIAAGLPQLSFGTFSQTLEVPAGQLTLAYDVEFA